MELEGGNVKIKYDVEENKVILSGTADRVFEGKIDI